MIVTNEWKEALSSQDSSNTSARFSADNSADSQSENRVSTIIENEFDPIKSTRTESTQETILIVDDAVDNLRLLSNLLNSRGYEVCSAISGSAALIALRQLQPDMILLDINMPQLNGYEVCRQLKASERTRDIPIIFLSALSDPLDKVHAFRSGGADYITKPFQIDELLARIEHQLQIKRLQNTLIKQNAQLQQAVMERDRTLAEYEKIQQQLQSLNTELSRSNHELEQFAYIVSHDLQQPLQSVTGFVRLITAKYEAELELPMRQYLGCISDAGKRMQQLIQDLLAYSRVGPPQTLDQPANCNEVLHEVLVNLGDAITKTSATILYDALPTVRGNETQLVQLFQNLISNAVKFVHPGTMPMVKIAATQQEQMWLFTLEDNGIGIQPEHYECIFEAFHRLHSDKEYEGTGIGLATCKKIITAHGGQIWVESDPDAGTRFYFTLPSL